jgi:hypothetical protein
MAKYPSVLFPAICMCYIFSLPAFDYGDAHHSDYGMAYRFGSILPAVKVSHVFSQHFTFSTLVIGLAYGGALM